MNQAEQQAAFDLEIQERSPAEQARVQMLKGLEGTLISKRRDAVAARQSCGIEAIWRLTEDNYVGVDDANRSAFPNYRWTKPTSMDGPLVMNAGGRASRAEDGRSTAFVRLTSRYVDAGAAKLSEILLPADDKAFSFTATPLPDQAEALKDDTQAVHEGTPLLRQVTEQDPTGQQVTKDVPITRGDLAQEAIDLANQKAKRAERRIYDWMVESRYRAEMRKIVFDGARCGTGVLKGPFPKNVTRRRYQNGRVVEKTVTKPAYEWKNFWNIYPDPTCGEHFRDGEYLWEEDSWSRKQLRGLKGVKGTVNEVLDQLLKVGPAGRPADHEPRPGQDPSDKNSYRVWQFYGAVRKDEMLATGGILEGDAEKYGDSVFAIATLVDDKLVSCVLSPVDSGAIPYNNFCWQRRPGSPWGVGVGEQLEMPQRAINATIRAMFNNAGKSAGGISVVDREVLVSADGGWDITPDKVYYSKKGATSDDMQKAFAFFKIPNVTPQLMSIVELCLKLAEETTNIPLVTQGQSGTTTPETYGAAQLQNNNANQLLRSIGYAVDDYITEFVVTDSYEYLLMDPDIPESEKGDWTIDAHGSAALVERAIQDQTIQLMGNFVKDPAFGVNPKRWFAQFAKTKHLNPADFQYTEAEQAEIDKRQPPPAPAVQVAQIKSADAEKDRQVEQALEQARQQTAQAIAKMQEEGKAAVAQMKKDMEAERIRRDTDRDTVYVDAERRRTSNEYEVRMKELEVRRELEILKYANQRQMKLDDVKKQLADTQMKLEVQRELAGADRELDMHKHHNPPPVVEPATEPPGKAPNGEGFQK